MAQQINLYNPILLAQRRYFSARAMAHAILVFAVLLALACAWVLASAAMLRRELQGSTQAQASERQRLTQALAAEPAASGAALEQELAQAQLAVARQRALLDELSRGRLLEGRSHAAMLRMVAQTVPPSVWLTDIRLVEDRLELGGLALQPDALRPWLTRLAQHPLLADQRLAAVKLERVTAGAGAGAGAMGSMLPGTTAWSFQLMSRTPGTMVTTVATANDYAANVSTGGRP